jgi:hypothetical protein
MRRSLAEVGTRESSPQRPPWRARRRRPWPYIRGNGINNTKFSTCTLIFNVPDCGTEGRRTVGRDSFYLRIRSRPRWITSQGEVDRLFRSIFRACVTRLLQRIVFAIRHTSHASPNESLGITVLANRKRCVHST